VSTRSNRHRRGWTAERVETQHGGVETAKRLISQPTPSDGFAVLWEAGRLDLAAESIVVLPRYSSLFSPEVVERAQRRLIDHGHSP